MSPKILKFTKIGSIRFLISINVLVTKMLVENNLSTTIFVKQNFWTTFTLLKILLLIVEDIYLVSQVLTLFVSKIIFKRVWGLER